jgi:hypothetical protein
MYIYIENKIPFVASAPKLDKWLKSINFLGCIVSFKRTIKEG